MDFLQSLVSTFGPSGNEEKTAEFLRREMTAHTDRIETDAMGNLICYKRGRGKRVMLCAHMDQIGVVVTEIDERGFLRIHNVGGCYGQRLIGQHVVFENGVHGAIHYETDPDKSTAASKTGNDMSMNQLFVDIGVENREQALERVQVGDMAIYAPDFRQAGERVSSPYLDDRIGCYIVARIMEGLQESPYEVVAVFSAQEEVGLRGAAAAAYYVEPDFGIAFDVTPSGDTPKSVRHSVELGKGPAIKIMDSSAIAHPGLRRAIENVAFEQRMELQREVLTAGGTDTAAMQLSRAGMPAGCISIPCRYIHTPAEMCDMRDVNDTIQLMIAFLSRESF